MSEAQGIAPAKAAASPAAKAPVLELNVGRYIGNVVGKDEERAGKHINKRTGEPFELKEDRFYIEIAQAGRRFEFKVSREIHQLLQGNDVVEVLYELARSRIEGLAEAFVQSVTRIRKGDGVMPTTKQAVFRDASNG